jgi:exodeoxyribonuclease-1
MATLPPLNEDLRVTASIFWYDFETTGINPRCDRPLQVAGIRTDEALNEIAEPLNIYAQLSDDILPHPMACLITGITPQRLAEQGLPEAEFMTRLHAELAVPGTCGSGYNSLRFDDEVTRYSLYRNFFEPYGREWQGGNSRWDLIDLVRSAYALRPEGINWPIDEGRVSLKLESLTAANGIAHTQAHDALSDVRATIALARLVRDKQPKLYDFLYRQRSKARVLEQIYLLQPLLHVSGRYSAARHYISVVLPLAWHPKNRNALIVCDLQLDPQVLLHLDAQTLRERLYTRREQLTADQLPVPLKLLHVNRCPVLAPLSVLRESDKQRLQLDLALCQQHATVLRDSQTQWQSKLSTIYAEEDFAPQQDPEQQLYAGFLADRDRRLCEQVRKAEPEDLARPIWPFDDERLPELLFRYRARNFPQTLTAAEAMRWQLFCKQRLTDALYGAPNTLDAFAQALEQALVAAGPEQQALLGHWQHYVQQLAKRLDL